MTDGNKNKGTMDQSENQSDTGTFSDNPQNVSESGQKGGQASQQEDQNIQSEDTMDESYTGDR